MCGRPLRTGDLVSVGPPGERIVCLGCLGEPVPPYDIETSSSAGIRIGTPGGSAQREFERRRSLERQKAKQQRGTRIALVACAVAFGYVGVQLFAVVVNRAFASHLASSTQRIMSPSTAHGLGLLFAGIAGAAMIRALWGRRQTTESWGIGARGERAVAARLDALQSRGISILHDRRIPGSRANIDHVVVAPSGIFVIDDKKTKGRVSARAVGPIWNRGPVKLFYGGRERSSDIDGMGRQVDAVIKSLVHEPLARGVTIKPMLVLVGAEWGWFARPMLIRGVWIGWPKEMARVIARPGPLEPSTVQRLARELAIRLHSA